MEITRRDLGLLPLLAAGISEAAGAAGNLPSKAYKFEDLPVKVNGDNKSRSVFNGETHSGYPLEVHMTELGVGQAPHPPHHHVHEEMILVKDGTVEVTISGKKSVLGPGSLAYVASNEEHGWRNVGEGRALYFVVTLGRASA